VQFFWLLVDTVYVDSVKDGSTTGYALFSNKHLKSRSLSSSIEAQKGKTLSSFDPEGDALDRPYAPCRLISRYDCLLGDTYI
jgi:hypothetical protein